MVAANTCGNGSGGADDRCGNGLEKLYPTTAVRYGKMNMIGEFTHPRNMKFTCGAKIVIQTHRGLEIGEQVSLTCTGCSKSVSRDQMIAYVKNSGNEYLRLRNGRILREATPDDLTEDRHIVAGTDEKRKFCQNHADEAALNMKVVECEHLFGGERIVYYFRVKGDGRVDFRDLVRLLAAEYQTRIEMRQVGARDEARLVADYETCGRECCCKNFLKTLKPISMKMAKMQKATLDPSKVSGRCGRLKCCLRYEQEGYEEMDAKLPRVGERIRTMQGDGVVIHRQILTQLVQFRTEDDRRVTVVIEDVTERNAKLAPREETKRDAAQPSTRSSDSDGSRGRRRRGRRNGSAADGTSGPEKDGTAKDGTAKDGTAKDRSPATAESPTEPNEGQRRTGETESTDQSAAPRRRRRRGRRRGKRQGGESNRDAAGGPDTKSSGSTGTGSTGTGAGPSPDDPSPGPADQPKPPPPTDTE